MCKIMLAPAFSRVPSSIAQTAGLQSVFPLLNCLRDGEDCFDLNQVLLTSPLLMLAHKRIYPSQVHRYQKIATAFHFEMRGRGGMRGHLRRMRAANEAGRKFVRLYPLAALGAAMILGVVLWGGFNWSIELTNSEKFCISCHVMRDNVYKEYTKTIHFENRTGVRATCPDCHVPKEWAHKTARKISATNELFHWLKGTISTREKFEERRLKLARHVWSSMRASDSRECRNCHGIDFMKLKTQSAQAAKMHELAGKWKMTCIDCHQGIAHQLPRKHSTAAIIDQLHERFETEKIECRTCHEGMAAPPKGEDW